MTDKIKRHKGARYIRVYCHQDNLYASALGGSVGASLGEDEPDPVPSGEYPHPSYKCSSRGAIYLDKSNPEKGSVIICMYSSRDVFFVSLTQNGFMWLLMPSQTASVPKTSSKFQDKILLVARVIPEEFISMYSSHHQPVFSKSDFGGF